MGVTGNLLKHLLRFACFSLLIIPPGVCAQSTELCKTYAGYGGAVGKIVPQEEWRVAGAISGIAFPFFGPCAVGIFSITRPDSFSMPSDALLECESSYAKGYRRAKRKCRILIVSGPGAVSSAVTFGAIVVGILVGIDLSSWRAADPGIGG